MILKWKRIQLRETKSSDYLQFKDFLNSENFLCYMTYSPMANQNDFDDFLNELNEKHDSPEFYCGPFTCIIESKSVGMVGLGYKSETEVNYELWYLLNPEYSGKGIMQEAIECLFDYIQTFGTVNKVCAYSVVQNERSSKLLYRNNFKLINTFDEGFEKNCKKYDVQYFELELKL